MLGGFSNQWGNHLKNQFGIESDGPLTARIEPFIYGFVLRATNSYKNNGRIALLWYLFIFEKAYIYNILMVNSNQILSDLSY